MNIESKTAEPKLSDAIEFSVEKIEDLKIRENSPKLLSNF